MRFYTGQHQYYCGIDLHAKQMYTCIIDSNGEKLLHRNLKTDQATFLAAIAPYRRDLVVSAECMFAWYWLADLCHRESIPFVLGHALYMRAVHGAKTKNDKIDAEKIARLLRGGTMPMAYVYPEAMRATRDLLRRRLHLVRQRAERSAHIRMTGDQYNLPPIERRLDRACHRPGLLEHFPEGPVRMGIETDLALIDALTVQITRLEDFIQKSALADDRKTLYLLRSAPGIGEILSLTLFYEIHDLARFPRVGDFLSYCRLAPAQHSSAGKKTGSGGSKMGNAHLKWAFSQATALLIKSDDKVHALMQRHTQKYGKPGAMRRLSQKLARTVYYMIKQERLFDLNRFVQE